MEIPYPGQPDWDNRILELNNPQIMDTATLIEWIQRQLETEEETEIRREQMWDLHREWHARTPGIYACCINWNYDYYKKGHNSATASL